MWLLPLFCTLALALAVTVLVGSSTVDSDRMQRACTRAYYVLFVPFMLCALAIVWGVPGLAEWSYR